MQYNPYEYMLEIRNNRVLFQYLESSAVYYSDETGWTITGDSKEGRAEIYETSSGVLRFTLPISVPDFVTIDMLQKILEGLQNTIEGIVTPAEIEGVVYIEYHLHSTEDAIALDKALLKFLQERAEINKGFASLEEEYIKMEKAMGTISEGLAAMMDQGKQQSKPSINKPNSAVPDEADLSSLWNDMENIESKGDEDDEGPDDIDPTAPTQ